MSQKVRGPYQKALETFPIQKTKGIIGFYHQSLGAPGPLPIILAGNDRDILWPGGEFTPQKYEWFTHAVQGDR
jgi:hypothetical protein